MKNLLIDIFTIIIAILAVLELPLTVFSLRMDRHLLLELREVSDEDIIDNSAIRPLLEMVVCQTLMIIALVLWVFK